MHPVCSKHTTEIRAPAKLNLFLEVLAKRPDGYHEIETVMAPVSLYDTLRFCPTTELELVLDCRWAAGRRNRSLSGGVAAALGELPPARENIVMRAVELFRQRAGVERGARIELIKHIPAAAGLGGASSDASAALLAANHAWGVHWPRAKLADLAAELGSDIPFFLYSGPALCRGRGEQITPQPIASRLHVVVVRPPVGLATPLVYKNCTPAPAPRSAERLLAALRTGQIASAAREMANRLQSAAERLCPALAEVRRAFAELGLWGHQLTGSGTSYFGVCASGRHALRMAGRLRARRIGEVYAATTLPTFRAAWAA